MTYPRLVVGYAILVTVLAGSMALALLAGPYRAVERSDYMTYHVAARIVLAGNGHCLYDARCQAAFQRDLIGTEPTFPGGALPYNSPPWFAVAVAPFGLLPLAAGFALFTAMGLAALAVGARALARDAPFALARVLTPVLILTAMPTVLGAVRGQSTILVAGLIALAVAPRASRAGLALGLAAFKPTLVPLVAAHAIRRRQWRVVAIALAVTAGLAAASAAVVGVEALVAYPGYVVGIASEPSVGVHPNEMINWRGAAVRLDAATWLMVVGVAATLLAVIYTWTRDLDGRLAVAAALVATPLVIPHANQHEFVLTLLGVAVAVLDPRMGPRPMLIWLAILTHVLSWAGLILNAVATGWVLFGLGAGWMVIIAWLALRQAAVPYFRRLPVQMRTD